VNIAMIKGKYGKADLTPATRFQVKYLGSGITEEPYNILLLVVTISNRHMGIHTTITPADITLMYHQILIIDFERNVS
jgi:hypothetical protein